MRLFCLFLTLAALGQTTLPDWVFSNQAEQFIEYSYPECLKLMEYTDNIAKNQPRAALINIAPAWQPADWKKAGFELKAFIVSIRSQQPDLLIGLNAPQATVESLMAYGLAPYIDGYLFEDIPWIPDQDLTGKGWYRSEVNYKNLLTVLCDADAVGAYLVILDGFNATANDEAFLKRINQTQAGTMDPMPHMINREDGSYQFFFNPGTSTYYLGFYGQNEQRTFYFKLKENMETDIVYPEDSAASVKNYGDRVEVTSVSGPCLVRMHLRKPEFQVENVTVSSKSTVDPNELIVKNQVFVENQAGTWQTLQAKQDMNYRYQATSGATVDVTYRDSIFWEKDQPVEYVRQKMFINGVIWPYKDLPELPLIQPEKVQSEPLVINLDKTYSYTYAGEDKVDGHVCWKVRFEPNEAGNFLKGTVWIDQKSGAHRKVKAIQSGLKPPVIGNEMTAYFDWVTYQGKNYWLQIREKNLQILNVVGVRIPLQIQIDRSEFQMDNPQFDAEKEASYQSDHLILRDSQAGFRYLKKEGGQRVVSKQVYSKQKFALGGVLYDPGMDYPVPLAGFNYVNLDFLQKGYQANFFIAGAINDIILSNSDFLGKGWDLTGEAFLTAFYFSDAVYRGGESVGEEEVKKLTESVDVTLGIPIGTFFKLETNLASKFIDYKEGDDTREDFVLPQSHIENRATVNLMFTRGRFSSSLEAAFVKRSKWEKWGLPESTEPLLDSYRTIRCDMSLTRKLPKFQSVQASLRYLKGWDLDRFSRFGFGFFENHVAGFGTSGIEANQALRFRLGYQRGVKELFQLGIRLDAARAWQDAYAANSADDTVDLMGIGISTNLIGPWKTVIRFELGYGFHSDLADEEGEFNGQLVFLKLF
ncbi:MAG: hypothetical protein CSA81_12525 [Acidobacteria bacterium]|nr:MAG: hypothetical protein CSA81_12525 [Acidobacteriota bacterium]